MLYHGPMNRPRVTYTNAPSRNPQTYAPPCDDCEECGQQYLTTTRQIIEEVHCIYKARLSDHEARLHLSAMITKLQEDRGCLREIQQRQKKDIGIEWIRLLPSDREALLRQVDPDMYPYRWGEARFCAEYYDGYDLGTEMRRFRSWNLHPDINLEELSQDANQFLRFWKIEPSFRQQLGRRTTRSG